MHINTFRASGNYCRLVITFVNCSDPDQDRCTLKVFLKVIFEKKHEYLPSMQRVKRSNIEIEQLHASKILLEQHL